MTQEAFGRAARTYGDTVYRVALPFISSGAYDYPRDQRGTPSGNSCSGTI